MRMQNDDKDGASAIVTHGAIKSNPSEGPASACAAAVAGTTPSAVWDWDAGPDPHNTDTTREPVHDVHDAANTRSSPNSNVESNGNGITPTAITLDASPTMFAAAEAAGPDRAAGEEDIIGGGSTAAHTSDAASGITDSRSKNRSNDISTHDILPSGAAAAAAAAAAAVSVAASAASASVAAASSASAAAAAPPCPG